MPVVDRSVRMLRLSRTQLQHTLLLPRKQQLVHRRLFARQAAHDARLKAKNQSVALYTVSIVVGLVGAAYASVPLYKMFCQVSFLCKHPVSLERRGTAQDGRFYFVRYI